MHSAWTVLSFAVGMLLAQFSPGPDMILLTATAVRDGWRRTWFMVVGIASGLLVLLAVTGLGSLLRHPAALPWLYGLGALYLLRLGIPMLRGGKLVAAGAGETRAEPLLSRGQAWRAGFFCNIFNPKAIFFLTSFMLGFLGPRDPVWWRPMLCLIVVFQALVFWTIYIRALDSAAFRRFFRRHALTLSRLCGLALIAVALKMLWTAAFPAN